MLLRSSLSIAITTSSICFPETPSLPFLKKLINPHAHHLRSTNSVQKDNFDIHQFNNDLTGPLTEAQHSLQYKQEK